MKFALPLFAASAMFALASHAFATPALADDPKQNDADQVSSEAASDAGEATDSAIEAPAITAPETAPEPAPEQAAQTAEEEERICRSIRVDASSRRKTRVCLTQEGWRQLNQRR